MTALNTMPEAALRISATASPGEPDAVAVRLHNPTDRIAFFQRVELLAADGDGDEILPVTYDDNYVTVFPGEQVDIRGRVPPGGPPPALVRVSGYNSQPVVTAVR
jgi:exo-1,4-beta-D-glucosaminidase